MAFQLDVTLDVDWRSVAAKSRDVGEVDIVVNNAGYFPNRSITELDLPTWRKMYENGDYRVHEGLSQRCCE
jgi:NADP-dependent 3-hydroxy acid dehydrogenase YdfG